MQQNVQDLINFIHDARDKNMSDEEITDAAHEIGLWNTSLIRAAVVGVDLSAFTRTSPTRQEDFNTIDGDFSDGDSPHFYKFATDESAAPGDESAPEDTQTSEDHQGPSQFSVPEPSKDHDDAPDTIDATAPLPQPLSAQDAVYGELGIGHNTNSAHAPHQGRSEDQQQRFATPPPPPHAGLPTSTGTSHHNAPAQDAKLPILQTVIHHVSLWVFLLFSIPAIVYLVNFLIRDDSSFGHLTTLTTFAAIIIVSGGLYATLYGTYLRKMRRDTPSLRTGKVFAILTITGSTIGAVISGIVLLNSIINYTLLGEHDALSNIVSAFLVTVVLVATILTYHATDIRDVDRPSRKTIAQLAPLTTAVILLGLFLFSSVAMPGAVADKRTVDNLVEATSTVREYVDEHDELPDAVAFETLDAPENIRYEYVSSYEYKLCADLNRATDDGRELYRPAVEIYDDSVSTWTFNTYTKGNNCFDMQNRELYDQSQNPPYEPYPIPYPMPEPIR